MWNRLMYFRRYLLFWAIRFFRVFLRSQNLHKPPLQGQNLVWAEKGHDTAGIKKSFGQILFFELILGCICPKIKIL